MSVTDGDIVRGVLSMTMTNGDVAKNVFTWLVEKVSLGDWVDAEIATFIEDAIETVLADITADITNAMSYDVVDIYKWDTGVWDYLTTIAATFVAGGVGEVLPPGCAMLMTAYTNRNKVFGRKFLYGVIESEVQGGVLSAGALTNLAASALEYITAYSDLTMGVLDFLHPGVYSSKAADFEPFNDVAVVKDTMSYQRRRKTGVGV